MASNPDHPANVPEDDLDAQLAALLGDQEDTDIEDQANNQADAPDQDAANTEAKGDPPAAEDAPTSEEAPSEEEVPTEAAPSKKPALKLAPKIPAKKPLLAKKQATADAKPVEVKPVEAKATAPPAPKPATKPLAKLKKLQPRPFPDHPDAAPSKQAPKDATPTATAAAAAKGKAAKPAAAAKAAKPAAGAAGASPGPKRPRNAFMIFASNNREQVKADNPAMTMGELSKRLGELYAALGEEDKAELQATAAEDKARYDQEVAAAGGLAPKQPRGPKKPRAKTAYELFCADRRPGIVKDNPKAGMGEISKLLSQEWAALSEEDKAPFHSRNKELKAEVAAAAAAQGPSDAPPKKKRGPAAGSRAGGASKRARKGAAAAEDEEQDGEGMGSDAEAEAAAEEGEEGIDRENVDWAAHPAVAILSKTRTGKYIVMRRGLGLHEYGEVPVAAANMQRAGYAPEGDTPCPLSVEMVDEFENFLKTWKREIHDNTDGTELVLDTLQPGTLLEACSFLGDMRSAGHELERLEKRNDMWLKVPLMATCRMIQRVVDTLRAEGEQWRTRCLEAEAALKKGAAAGEEVEMAAEA